MTAPPSPTYRSQPSVDACSIATRAFTAGGSTSSRYSCGWRSKSSQHGMLTTRALMPSRRARLGRRARGATSEPVASRITSGLPSAASASTYAPFATPAAGANTERSSVGRVCRDRISADGSCVQAAAKIRQVSTTSFASAGPEHEEPGHRAQRRELLDRLVRRAVLADADRVVREDVHDGDLHQRREADRAAARSRRRSGTRTSTTAAS